MVDHIDYSQYKIWNFCKWAWYEKYVLRRQKRWPAGGMRDDALAVGSLVHAGLEGWYAKNTTEIPEEVVVRINPTPEALRLCQGLVFGYIQTYPREAWEFIRCEKPVRFDLIHGKSGLAKIDMYFYIPERVSIESGVPGYEITLNPGWWIQEYKTKSQATKFAEYMRSWQTNMQADFQMLALQSEINIWRSFDGDVQEKYKLPVNGLLINIIEKPNTYIPKRTCKQCKEVFAFSAWTPEGDAYRCPRGHEQKLEPIKNLGPIEGHYFRLMVERTPEQLEISKKQIAEIAEEMQDMVRNIHEEADTLVEPLTQIHAALRYYPNREKCLDLGARYAQECEYFKPHTYGISTVGNEEYEDTEDYINEVPAA